VTEGLRYRTGWETFGRAGGPVRRPGHNAAPSAGWGLAATQSVASARSHAPRGNENYYQNPRMRPRAVM